MKKLFLGLLVVTSVVCLINVPFAYADRQGGGGIPIGGAQKSPRTTQVRPVAVPDFFLLQGVM